MKTIRFAFVLFIAVAASVAVAGTPNYTYLRSINLSPHPTAYRMTSACAGPSGSIYFVDNGTDDIYCIPTPLTATGSTNGLGDVPLVSTAASFGSGYSFNGIVYDGSAIFASGADGSKCQVWKVTGTVGSWTAAQVTGMPNNPYSGCAAVGAGKLVLSREDTLTNGLQFFTITGTAAASDGTVSRTGPLSPRHTLADMTNGKIYQVVAAASLTGGVQVFDTTAGTPATTTYSSASNPLVNTSASSLALTADGLNYAQMTVDPVDQVIVVARNGGTVSAPVWALYDVSAGGTNLTPYATINGAGGTYGALDSTQYANGAAFFTVGSDKYLALGRSDGGIQIYQKSADSTPPTIHARTPAAGATVASLPSVSVTFSEVVTGVAPGDLTVNGIAATSVSGSGAGPYVFAGYTAPANGTVTVNIPASALTDSAGNPFAGASWTYTKDSALTAASPGPIQYLPFDDAYIVEAMYDLLPGSSSIADWTGWTSTSWVSPNAYNNHGGTDFSLSTGTPEYAAAAGTVTTVVNNVAENNYGNYYGNYVKIATGAASPTGEEVDILVAHMLPNVQVSVGQTVTAGQLIGYSDNTGDSTSEHCHLQAMMHATEATLCPFYNGLFKYPIMFNPNARVQVGHVIKVKTASTAIRADRFDSSTQLSTAYQNQHFFACFAKRGYWRVHIPNDASNRSGWIRATDVDEVFEGTVIQALPDAGAYVHATQLAAPYPIRATADVGGAILGYVRFGGGRFVADQQAAGGWYRIPVPGASATWGWVKSDLKMVVYPQLYNPSVDLGARPNNNFPLVNSFNTAGAMTWGRMKFDRGVVKSFSPASPGGDGNAFFLTDVVNFGNGTHESMTVGRPEHTDYYVQADVYCSYNPAYGTYERVGIFLRDDSFGGFDTGIDNSNEFEGAGNCYAMTWDSDDGRLRTCKSVDGDITDFSTPAVYYASSGWRRFRIEAVGTTIRYYLDGALVKQQTDTEFASGPCGIGYTNYTSGNPAARGCYYDNFKAGDLVAPVVLSVATVSHQDVDITFTEANGMGSSALTAAYYEISGTGKGTLAINPDTVTHMGGNTYRLHWNIGSTITGGAVTITCSASILDSSENAMGSPNSGTDPAAVPVNVTGFSVE